MAKRRTTPEPAAELERLDDPRSPAAAEILRSSLAGGSDVAARAAEIVREHELPGFEPDLVAAFERLLGEDDPQCRAKTAIVDALATLEYRDAEFYLRHIGHKQIEWVFSDAKRPDSTSKMVPVDVAAHLRGLCGHGLVQSDYRRPLPHLIDLLADPEKTTRRDAAQALAMTGRDEAALILRTKLLCGGDHPEVLGDCFAALLGLAPADGVPFVARFLDADDEDSRLEAAAALGGSARPEAVAALVARWQAERSETLREALLLAIGASRRPEGIDFLLGLVAKESPRVASQALTALSPSRFYPAVRDRVEAAVERRAVATLAAQFRREFADR